MKLLHPSFFSGRVELNLLANFAWTGWSTVIQLAFVPLYIRLMGIEAYGLVGFWATLQGMLPILEFGLSATTNREIARYSVQPDRAEEARDFMRTLEVGCWAFALTICGAIWSTAPFVSTRWLGTVNLPVSTVRQAVMLMGGLAATQLPFNFYLSGLMGLQRQVLANILQIVMFGLSSGGALLVLWLVSPTIGAFLCWQLVVSACRVALTAIVLWGCLPPGRRAPRFNPIQLRRVWRFSSGMSGINVVSVILSQFDKVVLSRLLSLELFGYYILATVVANGPYAIINSLFNTLFPRFTALAALGDNTALKHLYHRSTQVLAVLILPVAAVITLFPFDIIEIWTGNTDTARNVAPIASLLAIGMAMNGLTYIPYALQLAHGWTSLMLWLGVLLVLVQIPATVLMAVRYGGVGAAGVWATSQTFWVLASVALMHRRLLRGEAWRWYVEDVGLPLAGVILAVALGRRLITSPMPPLVSATSLLIVLCSGLTAAGFAAHQLRAWGVSLLVKFWMIHSPFRRRDTR